MVRELGRVHLSLEKVGNGAKARRERGEENAKSNPIHACRSLDLISHHKGGEHTLPSIVALAKGRGVC